LNELKPPKLINWPVQMMNQVELLGQPWPTLPDSSFHLPHHLNKQQVHRPLLHFGWTGRSFKSLARHSAVQHPSPFDQQFREFISDASRFDEERDCLERSGTPLLT
jgi:hypothetical protein